MIIAQPTFLPVRINKTLNVWFAGDRSAKTFNGPDVSQWNDLSGNNNHATQSTASNQPLFVSSMLNGFPGLDFTAFDFMDLGTAKLGSGNQKYTFVAVAEVVAGGASFIMVGGGAAVDQQLFFRNNAGTFNTGWFSNNLLAGALTPATFHLFTSLYDQVGRTHYIDGTNVGSDSATTKNTDGSANCTIALNSSAVDKQTVEICFFFDELNTSELDDLFVYLGNKYGISIP